MDVVLYEVVGFLDDNPRKLRARIHGVEVLGGVVVAPGVLCDEAPGEGCG